MSQSQIKILPPFRVGAVITAVIGSGDALHECAPFTIHDGSAGIFVVVGPRPEGIEWKGDAQVLAALNLGTEVAMEEEMPQAVDWPT